MFTNSTFILLIHNTWETLYMVFCASVLSIIAGIILGLCLYVTRKDRFLAQPVVHQLLGLIANIGRSIPFIILMVALIPFTRWLIGTSIGTNAAIVPLTLAAIPFYARIAEAAFNQVGLQLLETGKAIGLTPWQSIVKIVLPESKRSLLDGATLTIVALISYSAVVGAVGGGGLGEVAILYGYQCFDIAIMLYTIIILVVLVQLVQWLGDWSAKKRTLALWGILSLLLFLGSIAQGLIAHTTQTNLIRIGITAGPDQQIMATAQQVAKKQYGITLKVVVIDDYVLPNEALNDGELDANMFQHVPYLDAQIKAHGYKISPLTKTFVYPMGFYSTKIHQLSQVPYGALIAIPNDPSNEGRALLLLQSGGLIQLKSGVGLFPTPGDIVANPKHLRFKELDAADIPRALPDVILGGLTDDYVSAAHLSVNQALLKEGPNVPYANIIAVQSDRLHDPKLQPLIAIIHSPEVLKEVKTLFPNGAAIPAWTTTPS